MKRAACYLRVSTDTQTVENQRAPLAQLCAKRGWEPLWFEEVESGAKKDRPVLEKMLSTARRGEVEAVVLVALDRLGRKMRHVFNTVLDLNDCGVAVVSLREDWLDTSGPFRDVLLSFAAFVSDWERKTLVERTKAGLVRAVKEGKRLGRPPASTVLVSSAADRVLTGKAVLSVAARSAGVSERTLRRALVARGAVPSVRRGLWELPADALARLRGRQPDKNGPTE